MEEFEVVGKIDMNKLGVYKNVLATDMVILTNERKTHILQRHPGHYEILDEHIEDAIYDPDYILKDFKNENTIVILKEIIKNERNIKIIIKLATDKSNRRYNSIITLWSIRQRDYKKTIKRSQIIYKKLDNNV